MKLNGLSNFEFIIIEDKPESTAEERASREIFWIAAQDQSKLYNLAPGGLNPTQSEESRALNRLNQPNRMPIYVQNILTNQEFEFPSQRAAAKEIGGCHKTLQNYLKNGQLLFWQFIVEQRPKVN